MAPDEDDENEFRAPPHQEDRLWRHPSEVGAAARPVPARPTRSRPIGTILASGAAGALATTLVLGLGGSFTADDTAQDLTNPTVTAPPATTTPTTAVAAAQEAEDDESSAAAPLPTTTTTIRSFPPINLNEVMAAVTGTRPTDPGTQLLDMADAISPAVASIIAGDDSGDVIGAGLLVGSGDRMLTSYSLIVDLDPLTVTLENGTVAQGTISSHDVWTDLAVVDFNEPIGPPLLIEYARDTEVGTPVVMVPPRRGPFSGDAVGVSRVLTLDSSLPMGQGVELLDLMRTGLIGLPGTPVIDQFGGRLVGLLTGAEDRTGHVLPLGRVAAVANSLIQYDSPGGGWLGITGRAESDPIAGVQVVGVEAGGPADIGGVRDGDVIFQVAQTPVASMAELKRELRSLNPDLEVPLRVWRDDAEVTVTIMLGQPQFDESSGDISPDPDAGTVRDDVPPGNGSPVEPIEPLAAVGP